MRLQPGLHRRIVSGVLAYTLLLTFVVVAQGVIINEKAEFLIWDSLLSAEADHFVERSREDPDYHWTNTDSLAMFRASDTEPMPASIADLPPGVHDDVIVDGIERVVLVRGSGRQKLVVALDIAPLETSEEDLSLSVVAWIAFMILLLGIAVAWSVGRLVRPLSDMAVRIGELRPDRAGQRIHVPDAASAELRVIAEALNGYLQRNEHFVERERVFIDSASHELRTPVAVIAGATELALEQPDVPASVRQQLTRIHRTVNGVEELIALLLVLAKEPARLASISERVSLDQLLQRVIEDHRFLTRGKDLEIVLGEVASCEIDAPLSIVQAAIGNLLRNAIENSDRGRIKIDLRPGGVVVIEDPGHGMSPEEISAVYARMARGGEGADGEVAGRGREGAGIGLDLITRLCEHLGWSLQIVSDAGQGTTATLGLMPRDRLLP